VNNPNMGDLISICLEHTVPRWERRGLLADLCSPLRTVLCFGVNTPRNSGHRAGGDQSMVDDVVKKI